MRDKQRLKEVIVLEVELWRVFGWGFCGIEWCGWKNDVDVREVPGSLAYALHRPTRG
jgi:hypothetical protein